MGRKLGVWISDDLYERLDSYVKGQEGKIYGLKKAAVEEALNNWFSEMEVRQRMEGAHTHINVKESKVLRSCEKIMGHLKDKAEFMDRDIAYAVGQVRGRDPRTLGTWRASLFEYGFIERTGPDKYVVGKTVRESTGTWRRLRQMRQVPQVTQVRQVAQVPQVVEVEVAET